MSRVRVELDPIAIQKVIWWALESTVFEYMKMVWSRARTSRADTGEFHGELWSSDVKIEAYNAARAYIPDWQEMKAVIAEFGRDPGGKQPPFDALVWWVVRKWGMPWFATGSYEAQPHETKFSIRNLARSIARKWVKPRKIFEKTLLSNKQKIGKIFKQEVARIAWRI